MAESPRCSCWLDGYEHGRTAAEATIEAILAKVFSEVDPSQVDRNTWQTVLRSVEERAYQRGLAEGLADD